MFKKKMYIVEPSTLKMVLKQTLKWFRVSYFGFFFFFSCLFQHQKISYLFCVATSVSHKNKYFMKLQIMFLFVCFQVKTWTLNGQINVKD